MAFICWQHRPTVVIVADSFGPEELALGVLDERVVYAHLACLSADPGNPSEGDWVLLLEDLDDCPVVIAFVGPVFDFATAPIELASETLTYAGYEHTTAIAARPWAASWRIIPREDRLPS